jgi:hypothetical protein
MAANTLTLQFDDETEIMAMIEGEMDDRLAELLTSGDQLRLRADVLDVSGHATSEVVSVWVAGPDDTEGHALALRLPSSQAARDLQLKLIAGGALAVVIASGAIVAQGVSTPPVVDSPATTISAGAVHPGATREHLRTDAPAVAAPLSFETGAGREHQRPVSPVAAPDEAPAPENQVTPRGPDKSLPGV